MHLKPSGEYIVLDRSYGVGVAIEPDGETVAGISVGVGVPRTVGVTTDEATAVAVG